jgi:hypothetical protein
MKSAESSSTKIHIIQAHQAFPNRSCVATGSPSSNQSPNSVPLLCFMNLSVLTVTRTGLERRGAQRPDRPELRPISVAVGSRDSTLVDLNMPLHQCILAARDLIANDGCRGLKLIALRRFRDRNWLRSIMRF